MSDKSSYEELEELIKKLQLKLKDMSTKEGDGVGAAALQSAHSQLVQLHEEREKLQAQLNDIITNSRLIITSQLEEAKEAFSGKINETVDKLEQLYTTTLSGAGTRKSKKHGAVRKTFFPQDSYITVMLREEHFRTIFNIALTVLVLFGLNIAVTDYFEKGTALDFSMLQSSFAGASVAAYYWCLMFVASFFIIPLAHLATISQGWLKLPWIGLYAAAQFAAFAFSGWVVMNHGFAPPLAMGFMAEQTRMSMKSHAYLREKMLWYKFGAASEPGSIFSIQDLTHEVQCFFYFLWVPTLVYREQYPRTTRIRWGFVITRALESIGIIAYAFVLFRSVTPQFEAGAFEAGTFKQMIVLCFACMAPGMALMFFTHFLVLHAVQNMFAEITRFADRKFYEDWWNAKTWGDFYRKWNGVVHDFIHTYIYMDLIELAKFPKFTAMMMSFIISAILHEYIVTVVMGFFLPILFVLFGGPGILFIGLTRKKTARIWNVFMWIMLSIGTAMLMVIYSREYFARYYRVPPAEASVYDYVVPYTWRLLYVNASEPTAFHPEL